MSVGCGAFQCEFASHAALICLVSMDIANVAALLLVVPKDKMTRWRTRTLRVQILVSC